MRNIPFDNDKARTAALLGRPTDLFKLNCFRFVDIPPFQAGQGSFSGEKKHHRLKASFMVVGHISNFRTSIGYSPKSN